MKAPIIILGMHRSGTSAAAGALSALGLHLGKKLINATEYNPKAYFESRLVVALNDSILRSINSTWDDVRSINFDNLTPEILRTYSLKIDRVLRCTYDVRWPWAIKDPRLCRVLPVWLNVLDNRDAMYLLVYRNPQEVCASLFRRDGFSERKALALWTEYNLSAEYFTRDRPRLFVDYQRLINEPTQTILNICSWASITPTDDQLNVAIRHIGVDLHRNRSQDTDPGIPTRMLKMLKYGASPDEWDRLRESYCVSHSALEDHIENLNCRLANLEYSYSWRVTSPLRSLGRAAGLQKWQPGKKKPR